MKFSATALLLSAAIGASAHPSGHAHRHAHRSLEARDFFMAKKPAPYLPPKEDLPPPPAPATSKAAEPKPSPKPEPKPAPAAEAAAAPASSSAAPSKPSSGGSGEGEGPGVFTPFCGGNQKRATAAQIAYQGNIGGSGSAYGCNQMTIKSNIADQYDYTVKFKNAGGDDQICVCWNKIGKDLGINGFFKGNEAIKFTLPGNGEQYVAFDKNTQAGCACGTGSVPLTSFGQFASTWFEGDFGNESNQAWSGYDASCLVSAKYGLDIPGMNVCDELGVGQCSTIYAGGTGKNAYLAGMEADDGVGGNLAAGKVRLAVTVNYKG